MCKDKGLDVSRSKRELVKTIAKHAGQCTLSRPSLCDGKLDTVHVGTRALARLSVSELLDILHHHGFSCLESKDEMVLRVAAIQNGRFDVAFNREMEGIEDLVTMAEWLIVDEMSDFLRNLPSFHRQRSTNAFPKPPRNTKKVDNFDRA